MKINGKSLIASLGVAAVLGAFWSSRRDAEKCARADAARREADRRAAAAERSAQSIEAKMRTAEEKEFRLRQQLHSSELRVKELEATKRASDAPPAELKKETA